MKKLSVALLLLASSMTLHAQHGGGSEMTTNPWWIGGGAGMNVWKFEHTGFYAGLEAGRWMSPVYGLSLRLSAFAVNGQQSDAFGLSALGTVTLDWTNLGGEVPGGIHFYTPLSAGAVYLMDDSRDRGSFAMSAALGLRYGFRKMDLFGEVGLMAMRYMETGVMPTITLGLRFSLPSQKEPSYPLKKRVSILSDDWEPLGLVDDMLYTNEDLHLPALVIRFSREDDDLNDNALRQLNLFASQVDAMGWDEGYYIIATADDAYASLKQKRRLCELRCRAVYKALVDNFGVDEYRLQVLPNGGYSEFAHQHSEQMVLIIQRTPDTEEVVERWISTY